MNELLTTITHRPYVFAFLATYLFLAWRLWGWKKTLVWLISGYAIAWASEYSSIHNGFPYGEYHYIYENLHGELLVAGVPFFDSLSYPFLIFAGYTTARFILRLDHGPWTIDHRPKQKSRWSIVNGQWSAIFLGALFTTLLDVIIDPIATMGDLWFLGKIHYYAHPGFYFGVPMTNFGGWFLVAFTVIGFNKVIWSIIRDQRPATSDQRLNYIYPVFYISIALFNISISFWVGQWKLGIASSAIIIAVAALLRRNCQTD